MTDQAQKYFDHPLAAEMHFADAMNLLAQSDYAGAEKKLAMIESKRPDAKVAAKAKEIRKKLKAKDGRADDSAEAFEAQPRGAFFVVRWLGLAT